MPPRRPWSSRSRDSRRLSLRRLQLAFRRRQRAPRHRHQAGLGRERAEHDKPDGARRFNDQPVGRSDVFLFRHVGMLPWPERAVYLLREMLRYSRRDTALLLGMSDANVDQLQKFAKRRIRYFSNASSQLLDIKCKVCEGK